MRFSLRTLLLAISAFSITAAGYAFGWRVTYELEDFPQLWLAATAFAHFRSMATCLWMWMPLLFLAFAVGARRLTARLVVAFAFCEAGAVGLLPLEHQLTQYLMSEAAPPVATP